MITLHLTEGQAEFLKAQMTLFAMNNPRHSWDAEIILALLTPPAMPTVREQLESVFADLYPAGGRE